jgi:hypothetical protein
MRNRFAVCVASVATGGTVLGAFGPMAICLVAECARAMVRDDSPPDRRQSLRHMGARTGSARRICSTLN